MGAYMKAWRIAGAFSSGRAQQPFSIDVVAADEDGALEKVKSLLGSRQRVSRRQISIDSSLSIDPTESSDPSVQHHFKSHSTG